MWRATPALCAWVCEAHRERAYDAFPDEQMRPLVVVVEE